jgi:uncharacterized protein (DUF934 family)
MALLKDGKIVEDRWTHLDDDSAAPEGKAITVSLARWQKDGEVLKASDVPLGIRLTGADDVEAIADALGTLQLVAIGFPAFTDGRGYSMARILRERYGYAGEIRATGDVLCDQASLMTRCGFDAFDLAPHVSVDDWLEVLALVDVQYQPAADRRQSAAQLRHAS